MLNIAEVDTGNSTISNDWEYSLDADPILLELVPELQPLRFKDLPISKIEYLLQLIAKAREKRTSSAIIWNTMMNNVISLNST
jgi:hypothetical protein